MSDCDCLYDEENGCLVVKCDECKVKEQCNCQRCMYKAARVLGE